MLIAICFLLLRVIKHIVSGALVELNRKTDIQLRITVFIVKKNIERSIEPTKVKNTRYYLH